MCRQDQNKRLFLNVSVIKLCQFLQLTCTIAASPLLEAKNIAHLVRLLLSNIALNEVGTVNHSLVAKVPGCTACIIITPRSMLRKGLIKP